MMEHHHESSSTSRGTEQDEDEVTHNLEGLSLDQKSQIMTTPDDVNNQDQTPTATQSLAVADTSFPISDEHDSVEDARLTVPVLTPFSSIPYAYGGPGGEASLDNREKGQRTIDYETAMSIETLLQDALRSSRDNDTKSSNDPQQSNQTAPRNPQPAASQIGSIPWLKPPNFPASANDKRPPMSYQYHEINHDVEFRLFRIRCNEELMATVEGKLEVYNWDKHPEYTYLQNSAAFSLEQISWIMVDGKPFPVSRGFEMFLRFFQWVHKRDNDADDVLVYALVICHDVKEPMSSPPKALSHCKQGADALQAIDDWPGMIFNYLAEREDPFAFQSERLPHPRQLDRESENQSITPIHMPLDRSVDEIRLLVLQVINGEPHFYMWHTPLHEGLVYNALSYHWGTEVQTITVHGYNVQISSNLHGFLTKTIEDGRAAEKVHPMLSRFMIYWIDAVCINQANSKEKSHEIKRMHKIYSNAIGVTAWLGEGNLHWALQWRDEMSKRRRQTECDGGHTDSELVLVAWLPVAELMDTFARPYFSRAWTTQELLAAKEIRVRCGDDHVPWETLAQISADRTDMRTFAEFALSHDPPSMGMLNVLQGIPLARLSLTDRVKARQAAGKPVTLLSLLLATLNMEATLPKDKIYSLWNVADDAQDLLDDPDYSQTDANLYTGLANAWMAKYKRMDILSIKSVSQTNEIPGLPTWVVNWSDHARLTRPFLSAFPSNDPTALDDVENERLYDASKGVDEFLCITDAAPSQSMFTAGISCDTIAYVTEPFLGLRPDAEWYDLAEGDDLFAALVAGRAPDGAPVEPHDPRKYYEITSEEEFVRYTQDAAWRQHIQHNISGRRLAITEGGHIGLVTWYARAGDEIAIVFTCIVPLVFRSTSLGTRILLGDAYFHRMMHGEMVDLVGGPEKCVQDMYDCVRNCKETREAKTAEGEQEGTTDAPDDRFKDDRGQRSLLPALIPEDEMEAAISQGGDMNNLRRTAQPLSEATSLETARPMMRRAVDIRSDRFNATMLDVLSASARRRELGDEGAWVQIFSLPGVPDLQKALAAAGMTAEDVQEWVRKRYE